jgi:hypothetical protein
MDQELCLVWLYCVIEAALRSMVTRTTGFHGG